MWIRDKPRIKDKSGYKTEYITVLHRLHNYKKGDRHTQWLCVCKCGIGVCDEWLKNFDVFYEWAIDNGYDDTLTIDRINVNGNYEPNNCRWVDMKTQQNNRTNNIYVFVKGEKLTMKQACEKYHKDYTNELRRYHRMSNEYEFIC